MITRIMDNIVEMEGIMRCSRYSFGPNRLHYCGPDANAELKDLIKYGESNLGLVYLLKQFKTLYPYLKHIASVNNIHDPFDSKVVEAYWLGNELLETIEKRPFHNFIIDDLRIKDKMDRKEFLWLEDKIGQGALPHHSFHVFNIWRLAGDNNIANSIEGMNECRVSSGIVTSISGPNITVSTEPLVYLNGKFSMGTPFNRVLTRHLESEYDIEQIKIGNIVSIHWGVPCEVITEKQQKTLKRYTLKNIAFANQTL